MSAVPQPDESTLEGFGYRQELRRVLRTFAVFAVAFFTVSITTGIFLNYGFGIAHLGPASIWLWPVAVHVEHDPGRVQPRPVRDASHGDRADLARCGDPHPGKPREFRSADYIIGGWCVLAAGWYFAVLRKRLREGVAAVGMFHSARSSTAGRPGSPGPDSPAQ